MSEVGQLNSQKLSRISSILRNYHIGWEWYHRTIRWISVTHVMRHRHKLKLMSQAYLNYGLPKASKMKVVFSKWLHLVLQRLILTDVLVFTLGFPLAWMLLPAFNVCMCVVKPKALTRSYLPCLLRVIFTVHSAHTVHCYVDIVHIR